LAFDLEPALCTTTLVGVAHSFRYDPLEPHPAGLPKELEAVLYDMVVIANRGRSICEKEPKKLLSRAKRDRTDVIAIEVKEIEREEDDFRSPPPEHVFAH